MSRKDGQVLPELFGKEIAEHLLVPLRARDGAVPVKCVQVVPTWARVLRGIM